MLRIGDVLENKFRIIDYLGQGRWGRVYLAENIKLGNKWAIKEIDIDRDAGVNLLAEPEILKRLNHKSLPRIIDVTRVGNLLYIIEDYFEGRNLKELIKFREVCCEENVVYWAKQLCEIMIYLHNLKPNPIIYRDMKPGNIIIDSENNVKLIDFGIAREFIIDRESDSTFIGTIGYAAPEQYAVGCRSDARTDIYGFGVTLYHVLTGVGPHQHPYQQVSVRELDKTLSVAIEKIITRCIHFDPNQRYQSASELLDDLSNARQKGRGLRIDNLIRKIKNRFQIDLLKEVVFMEKLVGTVVIAVGGTSRGVGCTYTSIAIAAFLERQKHDVAVVELNENPVLFSLEGEDSQKGLLNSCFKSKGIDFYCQNPYNQKINLGEVLRAGYNYVIVDLGCLLQRDENGAVKKSPWYDELNRATLRIVVAGSAVWQLQNLAGCLNEADSTGWNILFAMPDVSFFQQIKQEIEQKAYATVFNPDPWKVNEQQEIVFSGLLGRVLPKNKRAKNF